MRETNNYEKAILKAAELFKELDHGAMAQKLGLQIDSDFIYIQFFHEDFKIERKTGLVFACEPNNTCRPANFEEALSIYDLLSFSKNGAIPADTFCRLNSLHGISKVSAPMDGKAYESLIQRVVGREERFTQVLESLGGIPYGKGDISYKLPLFRDLCFVVSFWAADDEFPAQMYFMYDEHMLEYFRFETIWYVAGIIQDKLVALMTN